MTGKDTSSTSWSDMKIGFVPPRGSGASLDHMRQTTAAALARRHHVLLPPEERHVAPEPRRRELLKAWLAECDALVGILDASILAARRELDRCVPWAAWLMGCAPRGAYWFPIEDLDTRDMLVGTCMADAALTMKLFPNATVRVVPFAFDDIRFYRADETTRAATRATLGIQPEEKLLLYSGRLTLEKNVHTLLKTFRVVVNALPHARLVIAGREDNLPFREFGIFPLGIKRSLRRLCSHLRLDGERVVFVGQRAPDDLRALYSAADVLVNLTLHHDENFGFAQVEAMACGLPAVGTTWGGLKDTIEDGTTGAQVPAVVTAAGIKVDWWSAANTIVQLLASDGPTPSMRQRCCDVARERYSIARYGEELDRMLVECMAAAARPGEPLRASAFAEEYWAACGPHADGAPPFRRATDAQRLYRELIAGYAAEPMHDATNIGHAAWVLAAPIAVREDGRIAVLDPMYPLELTVPERLAAPVRALADQFAARPVLCATTLDQSPPATRHALAWMNEAGVVLRTPVGILDPACAPSVLGEPMFDMREVDHRADIVCFS